MSFVVTPAALALAAALALGAVVVSGEDSKVRPAVLVGDDLLRIFGIPRAVLPKIVSSSAVAGYTSAEHLGTEIPIAGIAGSTSHRRSRRVSWLSTTYWRTPITRTWTPKTRRSPYSKSFMESRRR